MQRYKLISVRANKSTFYNKKTSVLLIYLKNIQKAVTIVLPFFTLFLILIAELFVLLLQYFLLLVVYIVRPCCFEKFGF